MEEFAKVTFYKNCYEEAVAQNLPQGWLKLFFNNGNWTYDDLVRNDEARNTDMYVWYRHLRQLSLQQKHLDILYRGTTYDALKTSLVFHGYLCCMYDAAAKKYDDDATQYYADLSILRQDEVTGNEWWFDRHLREKHVNVSCDKMRQKVLELNNGVFVDDVFDLKFEYIGEKVLLFLVQKFVENKNVKVCADKETVRRYKTDPSVVSDDDVFLFSFMRRIGVIDYCSLLRYESKLGMNKNLIENYLKKYTQV